MTVVCVLFISIIVILQCKRQKETKETFEIIGTSANNFYKETQNAEGYLNDFAYNETTGKVEYHPQITLEKYDRIKEGMTEQEVTSILGDGEKIQPEGANSYLMTWGDLDLKKPPYCRVQITFSLNGTVKNKTQIGL